MRNYLTSQPCEVNVCVSSWSTESHGDTFTSGSKVDYFYSSPVQKELT